ELRMRWMMDFIKALACTILALVLLIWAIGAAVRAGWFDSAPQTTPVPAAEQTQPYEIQAQLACDKAIKAASANPSAAHIPYTPNMASAGGYMFQWKKGDGLTLQNGFGAKLDTAVTCVVAEDGATVIGLVVDGKKLIYKPRKHK